MHSLKNIQIYVFIYVFGFIVRYTEVYIYVRKYINFITYIYEKKIATLHFQIFVQNANNKL